MKKRVIKLQIMIPPIALVFFCGVAVLGISLFAYMDSVQDRIYEKINAARATINIHFQEIKESQFVLLPDILGDEEMKGALINGDTYELNSIFSSMLYSHGMSYGYITDVGGDVLVRLDEESPSENVSSKPSIMRALGGDITSSMIGDDGDPLRISTSGPIYDENHALIGTLTIGQIIETRNFAGALSEIVGCEVVLYVGETPATSSLRVPLLGHLTPHYEKDILRTVYEEGNSYKGTLDFYEDDFISAFYPLRNLSNEVYGMMFIGVSTSQADRPVLMFLLYSGIALIVFFVATLFLMHYVARSVIKKIEAIEAHTQNRDMLFESVNKASFILLEIDETDDIRMPLVSSMEYIGLAFAIDHVHLWRFKKLDDGENQFVREYSWVSEYAKLKAGTPKYINSSGDGVLDAWMDKFLENEIVRGIVADMEPSYQKVIGTLNAKSIAMMPIYLEEQFWGMFTIDNMQNPRFYTDDEIYILRSISLMMANIVRRHDLQNENLKVYYDALTGIYNRRYFDKTMARMISSLSRAGSELGLMMIDVDYFKKYNDTYGHGAGDECLIRVAEVLSQSANRVDDFVARYGGEEFVAVMPNTDREGAEQVAKRMLENIRTARVPHEASDVAEFVTISIGVTTGKVTHHHTPEIFIQRADDMLYKSKHDGRNRATYGELEETRT